MGTAEMMWRPCANGPGGCRPVSLVFAFPASRSGLVPSSGMTLAFQDGPRSRGMDRDGPATKLQRRTAMPYHRPYTRLHQPAGRIIRETASQRRAVHTWPRSSQCRYQPWHEARATGFICSVSFCQMRTLSAASASTASPIFLREPRVDQGPIYWSIAIGSNWFQLPSSSISVQSKSLSRSERRKSNSQCNRQISARPVTRMTPNAKNPLRAQNMTGSSLI